GRDEANEKGKEFLNFPNLTFKGVTASIIYHAQDFLVKYDLRPRDALHIITAIDNGLRRIVSFDGDFDIVTEIQRIDLMKE
ncbi:MAG: PilT protein, partial [Promethearchaeota archaeon CR_4]